MNEANQSKLLLSFRGNQDGFSSFVKNLTAHPQGKARKAVVSIPYQLIFDASTQPIFDRVYIGTFALIAVVSLFCLFVGSLKNSILGIAFVCLLIAGGFVLLGISVYHRAECRRWAQTGNYQVAEGPVENFLQVYHSGNKGPNYTIETFSVQGVGFRCKSGNDVFNGGFHKTDSPIKQGVQVKIAHREGQILKLWVENGGGAAYGN